MCKNTGQYASYEDDKGVWAVPPAPGVMTPPGPLEAHVEAHEEYSGDPIEVDNLECALCRKSVGIITGDADVPTEWRSYWNVWLDGDLRIYQDARRRARGGS